MSEDIKTKITESEILRILSCLMPIPSVSGLESIYAAEAAAKLSALCEHCGIEIIQKNNGNIILYKPCLASQNNPRKEKKKLLIDAHIDRIGMQVIEICDGGFVRASAVGGIDARTLAASDVLIIGRENVRAVIASIPPHLRADDEDSLPPTDNILIDTGLPYEEAISLVSVGDAVVFESSIYTLSNDCISAPSLDNKISAASAILALMTTQNPIYDTYVLLSSREESGAFSGIRTGINSILPDFVITIDVNFASAPGVRRRESITRGAGPSISFSALTDRKMTDKIIKTAKENKIPLSLVVEADNLGTNGNAAAIAGTGALIANMSLPLTNMHSTHECISLHDAKELAYLLSLIAEGGLE